MRIRLQRSDFLLHYYDFSGASAQTEGLLLQGGSHANASETANGVFSSVFVCLKIHKELQRDFVFLATPGLLSGKCVCTRRFLGTFAKPVLTP